MKREDVVKKDDLSGANLSGFSLGGVDLCGKVLRGADLSYAHLGCARLKGADLRNANLRFVNLGAADLTGADLRYADLRGANLSGAVLSGADLRECMTDEPESAPGLTTYAFSVGLEETEAFRQAQDEGFHPVSHWAESYRVEDGETLNRSREQWLQLKRRLGGLVFGDRETFEQVRLVQQYRHYSQWAYMITKNGFERIASHLNIRLVPKKPVS